MDLPELNDTLSPEEQFEITKSAAEMGNVGSMINLANFYEQGIGTPVDKEAAKNWRDRAGVGN